MNDYLPSDQIQEGLRGVLELLPLVYIIIVLMAVLAFKILDFNGELAKGYYWKIFIICISFAGVAYLFYPQDEVKIRDVPTLLLGAIFSMALIRYLSYRWKNKTKKK